MFLGICSLSPRSLLYLTHYRDLEIETSLRLKIVLSTLLLQYLPQVILQAYTLVSKDQITTILIMAWTFTSFSILNQFFGLPIIFVVMGSIRRVSNAVRRSSIELLIPPTRKSSY
eukprot:c19981_g1_i1.p1 GENE.c19981_g1_i1~~c19981_g1_i1.p1  ORF type:complete len:129 (-),score=35.08 c19981_g1_i1:152-496(-)